MSEDTKREIFEELKDIRTTIEDMEQQLIDFSDLGEMIDRLQEQIWVIGDDIGEF
jgi:hypothetical protein